MTKTEFRELQASLIKELMGAMSQDLVKELKDCSGNFEQMMTLFRASNLFTVRYCAQLLEPLVTFDE